MSVGNDPAQQRPFGEGGRVGARLSRRLLDDVRHGADLAQLVDPSPRRWTDALLAETRFHLAGLMNAVELGIGLHVTDERVETLLSRLGPGYVREAIEQEVGLLSPELLGHLRRRAAIAMLLRLYDGGEGARLAAIEAGAGNMAYLDALAALGIAERRWSSPMLLDAPMRPDLPAEAFHELAWTVAALLIRGCETVSGQSGPALVKVIAQATERLIGRHDEGQGAMSLARRCARSLSAELRRALAPAALADARLLLFAALAEAETGLSLDDSLDALTGERDENRHALLRLMGIEDSVAFSAAEMLGPLTGASRDGDAGLVAFVEAYRRFDLARAELWLASRVRPRALAEKLALLERAR